MSTKTLSWDKLKKYNKKNGGKFFDEQMVAKRNRRTHGTPKKKDNWFFFCCSENVVLTSMDDDIRIYGVYRMGKKGTIQSAHSLSDPYERDAKQLRFENRENALESVDMIINGDLDYQDYHWY